MYSEYGIVQAVQYIIGGDIKKNNNIISYGRFKLDKKWAESDMNFLAIIGDYIGRIFLKRENMINRYVALDIETTGLNPAVDRIIEVGMARVEDGQITQKYSTLVYPGISVSERITELTGIHNEELAGKPRIEEIIGDITRFIGDWPILGHNVTFDFSFLKRAAVNNGYTITDDGIDTLKIARRLLPELEHKNLSFLCQYFNIDPGRSHRAYDDAVSASILYGKLEKLKPEDNSFSNTTKLVYVVKKDSPITPPQRRYLAALVEKHNINLEIPVEEMTKSMASRQIDTIIAQYGK